MLRAFKWNLRVLSYISLVVGAFLIYNTIAIGVVRRRAEIGILRALGVARLSVFSLFAGEALLFGLAGSLREDDIEPLLPLRPDYLGFRGALTAGRGRDRPLVFDAVARIETRIGAGRRRAA